MACRFSPFREPRDERLVTDQSTGTKRVAVIGGGIAGLSAAHRIQELEKSVEIVLLESLDQLGGTIQTVQRDGFLVEQGPDMLATKDPWGLDLCRRLGCESDLIETQDAFRRAFVTRGNRLHPVPAGFTLLSPSQLLPLIRTRLLSPLGKLRALREYWVRVRRETTDESLADFTRRRLGSEVFERIVQPLVGGIYTADPEKLSMQATLAQFVEMERTHGGLIRGARQAKKTTRQQGSESGARYGMFVTLRNGLSGLVERLAEKLPQGSVQLNTVVNQIIPTADDRWEIRTAKGNLPGKLSNTFDGVVVATPVHATAQLVKSTNATLSDQLGGIDAASSAVVINGFRREDISHPLDGFGFVVPARERRTILACSFSSIKFAGRAPAGKVLLRTFVGGACQPEMLEKSDEEIQFSVQRELQDLIGVQGEPVFEEVIRWTRAMPQYHVGHLQRVDEIEQHVARHPGLELAGNGLHGVGIPQCIHSGESAAERLFNSWAKMPANV